MKCAAGDRRRERQVQDVGALDEEGALLLEEGLEGGQVDLGGVGLDLAEVGVDGQVEGEVVAQAELGVEAGGEAVVGAVAEGVARPRRRSARAARPA